jgi:hypothetical protein
MPNTFTTVSHQGFGNRLLGSIIGVPIGIILILGSCILLYWNEGRPDYSKIASKSIAVQASHVDQSQNGNFVSVTGPISSNQQIGDGEYLRAGAYIAIQRTVEEYAWVESQQSNSHSNLGGSSTNRSTYTYKEEWVDQPADSSTFQYPQGHQNPTKPLNDTLVRSTAAKVGAYSINPQTIKLPTLQQLPLNSANVSLSGVGSNYASATQASTSTTTIANPLTDLSLANSEYIFGGSGSLVAPQLGDIRISYKSLLVGLSITAFGKQTNGSLTAYTDSNNHTLYDLLIGDRQTAISTLHSQYERSAWIIRGVGILVLWLGLMLLFGPLDMLLNFIPIAGRIGGTLTLLITFPIALLIGGTVIIIGYTLHHIIALIIGVPLIFAIWIGLFKLLKKRRTITKNGSDNMNSTLAQQPINRPMPPSTGSLFPASSPVTPTVPTQPINVAQPPQPIRQPNLPPAPVIIQPTQSNVSTVSPQVITPTIITPTVVTPTNDNSVPETNNDTPRPTAQ